MNNKHLLFRVDTEFDSLLVVIPWTPDLVDLLKQQREAALPLVALGRFHRATFFGSGMEVFTLSDELGEIVADNEAYLVDERPDLDDSSRERIDCCQMGVDDDDVIFTFYLKHTSDKLETSTVAFDDEEFFPKN